MAEAEGISPRYVQKLFENAGETFGHYLRLRRLERCRAELSDPKYDHLSITKSAIAPASTIPRISAGHSASSAASRAPIASARRDGQRPDAFQASRGWPKDADSVIRRLTSSRIHERSHRPREAPVSRSARIAPLMRPDAGVIGAAPHHYPPANDRAVHWGSFSRSLPPVLAVNSGAWSPRP